MAIALSDLIKDLTKEDVLADLLAAGAALGLSTSSWQPGEPIYDLLAIVAENLANLWNKHCAPAIRGGFLDYAEGLWLDLLAIIMYGVTRISATYASTTVDLENRGGGFYTIVAGDIKVASSAGKSFTNIDGGTLTSWSGSGAYPTLTLSFTADEAGSDSAVAADDIAIYPTTPLTAPAGVYVVSNTLGNANDSEEDDSLKERCRLSTGPLSPGGPKSAYTSVALSTVRDDGTSVDVNRVKLVNHGDGTGDVYLAGINGAASGDTATDGSDVFLVNAALQTYVVPPGFTVTVQPAEEVPFVIDMNVYVDRASGLTALEAETAVMEDLVKMGQTYPIGGHKTNPLAVNGVYYKSEVEAVASQAAVGIFKVATVMTEPTLTPSQVGVPSIFVIATIVTQ